MGLHHAFWQQVVAIFQTSKIQSAPELSAAIAITSGTATKKNREKKQPKPIYLT